MATEVSPKSNRLFIGIGIILAVVAFVLVLFITKNGGSGGGGATQSVVVAKVDLAQGVAITTDMLTTAPYPVPAPLDSVSDPSGLVGQIPSVPVKANSPVTKSVLTNSATTPLGSSALTISDGMVAMAIPSSYGTSTTTADLQNVGNYIQPEDHIDLMVADGQGAIRFSFQDVRVLKVGVNTGAAPAAPAGAAAAPTGGSVLIIELPRNQAELMTYLVSRPAAGTGSGPQNTVVKYVLRPRKEYGTKDKGPNYINSTGVPVPAVSDAGAGPGQLNQLFQAH